MRGKKRLILLGAGSLLIVLASALILPRLWPSAAAPEPVIVTRSTDKPSESKQEAKKFQWPGKPNEPKQLRIPKIGVDSLIQKMGVDQNKQIAVPTNIHLAGWFVESARPGNQGLSIIAGHVTGIRGDGIFKQLSRLSKGDHLEVERGDGKRFSYEVIATTTVASDQANGPLFSQDPAVKSQINLITCGGKFNPTTQQYEARVIVSAKLTS